MLWCTLLYYHLCVCMLYACVWQNEYPWLEYICPDMVFKGKVKLHMCCSTTKRGTLHIMAIIVSLIFVLLEPFSKLQNDTLCIEIDQHHQVEILIVIFVATCFHLFVQNCHQVPSFNMLNHIHIFVFTILMFPML